MKHATSAWIIQQLREAFRFSSTPKFLIFGERDPNLPAESWIWSVPFLPDWFCRWSFLLTPAVDPKMIMKLSIAMALRAPCLSQTSSCPFDC